MHHLFPLENRARVEIAVGQEGGDFAGRDGRILQAAVDYVAALGGGTVRVRPGLYEMMDSLHVRSHVAVVGLGEVILRKTDGFRMALAADGDYGEAQLIVPDPARFRPGMGVTVSDERSGGFHDVVGSVVAVEGGSLYLNATMNSDYLVSRKAWVQNTFPVISVSRAENVRLENLIADGNRANNPPLNGCRGAGIYAFRAQNLVLLNCTAREFNGDGISFQTSYDVRVENCHVHHNSSLGLHPGSGSQRPVLRGNHSHDNGSIGLFLCWRVRHGRFEANDIHDNAGVGISIGHKDTDNLFEGNRVVRNGLAGVHFRDELEAMSGHRNLFVQNRFEDNGGEKEGYGVYVQGVTRELVFERNVFAGTPDRQRVAIRVGPKAAQPLLKDNTITGHPGGDLVQD
ncbi:MAG: right-handed parallel beta-helix repeat-containing protein [Planctomycetes bacterium]|nr:right-handed parallel beta-helix repeat-containing protein [Planctomycetota bacterium]